MPELAQLTLRIKSLEAEVARNRLLNLRKSSDQAEVASRRLGKRFDRTGGSAGRMGVMFGKAAKMLGLMMGSMMALMAARKVLKLLVDFEQGLVGVGKTANLAGDDLKALGEDIIVLSTQIPVATDELLTIAQAAGQLGVSGADNILLFTDTVAKLGTASDLAGDEAATALARILKITGEAVGTVDILASVIVELGNNSAATESEIAAMTTRLAQSTVVFGISSAKLAGLGAALRELGVMSELGGTAVGRVFKKIDSAVRGGGKGMKILERELKMTNDEIVSLNMNDPFALFMKFAEALGETESKGGNIPKLLDEMGLRGIRVQSTFQTLAKNTDVLKDKMKLVTDELLDVNALEEEAARAFATLGGAMKRFSNTVAAGFLQLREHNGVLSEGVRIGRQVVVSLFGLGKKYGQVSKGAEFLAKAIKAIAAVTAVWIGLKTVKFIAAMVLEIVGLGVKSVWAAIKITGNLVASIILLGLKATWGAILISSKLTLSLAVLGGKAIWAAGKLAWLIATGFVPMAVAAVVATGSIGAIIALLASIPLSFKLGQLIYEQFEIVQLTGAHLVKNLTVGWAHVKNAFVVMITGIKFAWQKGLNVLSEGFRSWLHESAEGLKAIGWLIDKITPGDQSGWELGGGKIQAWLKKGGLKLGGTATWEDMLAEAQGRKKTGEQDEHGADIYTNKLLEAKKKAQAIFDMTIGDIERKAVKARADKAAKAGGDVGTGFVDGIMGKIGAGIGGITEKLKGGFEDVDFGDLSKKGLAGAVTAVEELSVKLKKGFGKVLSGPELAAMKVKMRELFSDWFRIPEADLKKVMKDMDTELDKVNELSKLRFQKLEKELEILAEVGKSAGEQVTQALGDIIFEAKTLSDALRDVSKHLARLVMQKLVFDKMADRISNLVVEIVPKIFGFGRDDAVIDAAIPIPPGALETYGSGDFPTQHQVTPGFTYTALGAAFDRKGLMAFARGGVVDRPTMFGYGGGGRGLMGEAGPEAIMPLARGPGGSLGVRGSAAPVNINIINNVGGETTTTERQSPGGGKDIEILIEDVVSKSIAGGGKVETSLKSVYGLERQGVSR